jgi:hypothetical protein
MVMNRHWRVTISVPARSRLHSRHCGAYRRIGLAACAAATFAALFHAAAGGQILA